MPRYRSAKFNWKKEISNCISKWYEEVKYKVSINCSGEKHTG